mmetsp:Transcript_4988/g.15228  ORF Transcript_4988/g.15228 Transcript_4988/m.15228 type:complete len:758 (-) Transcript_4988:28-2301(-)|eukprot:CAMPEP_0174239644 /NCGR_PEP_ID=MMETSP0417-20130205/15508_1 /TAXON_ID=242541 /ORGANISM="Mayorella sp, Strain BSH-02190019" /LENGTH=757 /DNA_ID=CAMNT_0015318605 /DNA_START=29 /DNA_END=2302 /DNA_ORIENTATION=+
MAAALSDAASATEQKKASRLVVISNRLPISIDQVEKDDGSKDWSFRMSSGGLVAALSGVKARMSFMWVGWPGGDIDEADQPVVQERLLAEHNSIPVFLDKDVADLHYNGFSNMLIWPLFHYLTDHLSFDETQWAAYQEANRHFADVVASIYQPGDLLWVHDYHLMLLPEMLRERIPGAKIGFFLHIPFPSSEIYRTLGVRKQILRGLLHSDLIGFHTSSYARHFRSACTRLLGVESTPVTVAYNHLNVRIGSFPVGINPANFVEGVKNEDVLKMEKILKSRFCKGSNDRLLLLGVDRFDYIKGLPQKLAAFEYFLKTYPEFKDRVTLVQIAVPTRTDVPEYQRLIANVNETVGRINGIYGSLRNTPLIFLNQSVTFPELCALYKLADVAIVSSIRDGMNLVSYEYVASQLEKQGVLILSEFAGAAALLNGSLIVNPWNTIEMGDAIKTALTMPMEERKQRQRDNFKYVTTFTSSHWGKTFVDTLEECTVYAYKVPNYSSSIASQLKARLRDSSKRLFVIDDDGTLIALQRSFALAKPEPETLELLKLLSAYPSSELLVVSGRDRSTLNQWFAGLSIGIVAEHGYYVHRPGAAPGEWDTPHGGEAHPWKEMVLEAFENTRDRTPGSAIELKESHMTFHYRNSDPVYGEWQAQELLIHLTLSLSNEPVDIVCNQHNRTLDVRPQGVTKSVLLHKMLEETNAYDFVLYLGGDEDIVSTLKSLSPEESVCCAVGRKLADADVYLQDHHVVHRLIANLVSSV